jgi:hypothetical protein
VIYRDEGDKTDTDYAKQLAWGDLGEIGELEDEYNHWT